MKTIGMLCAWGSEEWISPAIHNASKYLDEIWVCVSYHHPDFKDLEDGSLSSAIMTASEIGSEVRIMDPINNDDKTVMPDVAKCRILNTMIRASSARVGDVLMVNDVDEFYDEESIRSIRRFVSSGYEMGKVKSRYFCVDDNHYIINDDMDRLFRMKTGFRFEPTQRPNPKPADFMLIEGYMFHYSMLLDPELKRRYWKYSPINNPDACRRKIDWLNNICLKWNVKDEEAWKRANERLTGNYGFWMHKDMVEAPGGGLMEFKGTHPEEVRNLKLRK